MKKKRLKKQGTPSPDPGVAVNIVGGTLTIGNAQHQGARFYQEDSFGFSAISERAPSEKGLLAVLADGMGGLKDGKAISGTAVSYLLGWFDSGNFVCCTGEDLKNAVGMINQKVCDLYCKDGMIESGTTLVAASVNQGYLHWFCVGDSRLYLKRQGALYQINEDHDFLNQMLADVISEDMTFAEAYSNKEKDSLVSCIGKRDLACFDYSKKGFRLLDGDILVLCSDGVYNALSHGEFNMNITSDAMDSCENIIKLIAEKRLPNQDNHTIVIISYKEKGV